MRIVKTKRTIGTKKWIGRRVYDSRFQSDFSRTIDTNYNFPVVGLIRKNKDTEMDWIELFDDTPTAK